MTIPTAAGDRDGSGGGCGGLAVYAGDVVSDDVDYVFKHNVVYVYRVYLV